LVVDFRGIWFRWSGFGFGFVFWDLHPRERQCCAGTVCTACMTGQARRSHRPYLTLNANLLRPLALVSFFARAPNCPTADVISSLPSPHRTSPAPVVMASASAAAQLFALLHGHSYTAYPVGCAATVASLELLSNPETNPNLCAPCRCPKTPRCTAPCGRLLPLWDEQREVTALSYHPLVSRAIAVGTVLAVELAALPASASSSSGGYASVSSVQVVRRLRDAYGIYARPLGSVVYLMVPPTARRETASWLAASLRAALDWCATGGAEGASGSRSAGRAPAAEDGVVV
jgi:hypothetical protein